MEYDDVVVDNDVVVVVDVVFEDEDVVEEVVVENELGLAPKDVVKFEILLVYLHMFIPDVLLFDFSGRAFSMTLSSISWSIYGTRSTFALFLSRKRFLGGFGASWLCLLFVNVSLLLDCTISTIWAEGNDDSICLALFVA